MNDTFVFRQIKLSLCNVVRDAQPDCDDEKIIRKFLEEFPQMIDFTPLTAGNEQKSVCVRALPSELEKVCQIASQFSGENGLSSRGRYSTGSQVT